MPVSVGQSHVSLNWGGDKEEGVDDDREERGKPHDLSYVGVGYHGYVHGHMLLG